MVSRAEEVCAILPELRIAKCKELVVSLSDLNAIVQSSVDPGEELVIALLVNTSIDSTLPVLVVAI